MTTTILKCALGGLALAIVLALATGCNRSYAHRIVETGESEITVSDREGLDIQTHEVAPDASITLDGEPADLEELAPGDAVNVKVESRDGMEVATEIDAVKEEPAEDSVTPAEEPAPAFEPTESEPGFSEELPAEPPVDAIPPTSEMPLE